MDEMTAIQAEIDQITARLRTDRNRLAALQERHHILRFGHVVGTEFVTEKKRGWGTNQTTRVERWKLVGYGPHGPRFQFIRNDGALGVRFGTEYDVMYAGVVTKVEAAR